MIVGFLSIITLQISHVVELSTRQAASIRGDEWSLRALHCDVFASTSRNKKIALRTCEQRKNLGSTSKRALV